MRTAFGKALRTGCRCAEVCWGGGLCQAMQAEAGHLALPLFVYVPPPKRSGCFKVRGTLKVPTIPQQRL